MKKLALVPAVLILALAAGNAAAATYYVDGNVAVSGNGLSWPAAKKTFAEIFTTVPNNSANLILVRGDQKYIAGNVDFSKNGLSDSQRQVFRGVPGTNGMGRLPIVTFAVDWDESAFSSTGTYDKVFWIQTAAVVNKMWDAPLAGEWGYDWRLYKQSASVAIVQTNPASWYSDGTTLFVRTRDGSAPSNFILKTVPTSGANQAFTLYGQYVTFENLEFRHYWSTALNLFTGCSYINVQSNLIHAIAADGVSIFNANVHHCKVTDNTIFTGTAAVGTGGAGINSQGNSHVFAGNVFFRGGSAISGGAQNCDIYANVIYSNSARGIFLNPGSATRIYNNTVFTNTSPGLRLINTTNAVVFNNTLYHNKGSEMYIDSSSPGTRIFNNTISAAGSGAYCIYVAAAGAASGLVSDYNNLQAEGGANLGRWPNANYTTLAAWQTASSQDAHSISVAPGFVNPAGQEFGLSLFSSPCIDAGTASLGGASAPAVDIDGDARPMNAGFDLGSDEVRVPTGTAVTIH